MAALQEIREHHREFDMLSKTCEEHTNSVAESVSSVRDFHTEVNKKAEDMKEMEARSIAHTKVYWFSSKR